jgi:C1A family cysteine protease
MNNIQWYGWRRDSLDRRDFPFTPKFFWFLPRSVDLRPKMPEVYNQWALGSCTANATAAALQYLDTVQKEPTVMPSRLFVYYGARELEGTIDQDAGAMIRDAIKVVVNQGACSEQLWPYDITKFAWRPSENCYLEAVKERVIVYSRLTETVRGMMSTLATGFPFIFGVALYNSFETEEVSRTGKVPMPGLDESPVGNHAMLCVGYNLAERYFIVRNSWGADWGDQGYCYIPFCYLGDNQLATDMWVLQKES